jgi:hypothetical protein
VTTDERGSSQIITMVDHLTQFAGYDPVSIQMAVDRSGALKWSARPAVAGKRAQIVIGNRPL